VGGKLEHEAFSKLLIQLYAKATRKFLCLQVKVSVRAADSVSVCSPCRKQKQSRTMHNAEIEIGISLAVRNWKTFNMGFRGINMTRHRVFDTVESC